MNDKKILVIDDESLIRKILDVKLKSLDYEVILAEDGEKGIEILKEEKIDLILSDLSMPGKSGFDVLKEVKKINKNIPVIIMTAYANIQTAIEALKLGAFDYIIKPFNMEEIPYVINKALLFQDLLNRKSNENSNDNKLNIFPELIGGSKYIFDLKNQLNKILKNNDPILISGAIGTGKKFLSVLLHKYRKKNKDYLMINVSTLSENNIKLIFKNSSLLAKYDTIIIINAALLNLKSQKELLKCIKKYNSIRFIFITEKLIDKYNYSEYFLPEFFKLFEANIIYTKPLREHKEDIPLLVDYFINEANKKFNKNVKDVDKETLYFLLHYHWPENNIELQSAIEKAVFMAEKDVITPSLLYKNIIDSTDIEVIILNPYLSYKDAQQIVKDKLDYHYISEALKLTNNNKTKAARLLNISLRQLQYRCKALKIK